MRAQLLGEHVSRLRNTVGALCQATLSKRASDVIEPSTRTTWQHGRESSRKRYQVVSSTRRRTVKELVLVRACHGSAARSKRTGLHERARLR